MLNRFSQDELKCDWVISRRWDGDAFVSYVKFYFHAKKMSFLLHNAVSLIICRLIELQVSILSLNVDELLSLATLCAYLLLNWAACFENFSLNFLNNFFQCNLRRGQVPRNTKIGRKKKKKRRRNLNSLNLKSENICVILI